MTDENTNPAPPAPNIVHWTIHDTHPQLVDRICRAFDRVSWEKDFTLIEGTGHAGVGSVFGLGGTAAAIHAGTSRSARCAARLGR